MPYVPDYTINIGGVFLSMCEVAGKDIEYVFYNLEKIISKNLETIISESMKNNETLFESSERIIAKRMRMKQ